ncbi:hypothetical protein L861_23930 [Litchfieldella anticariensis FP35 = DSM 16096]|uniref:HIT domain-containing protein n=1 Tax=Litchfieldella anticariensis (strain DSM 16096 / CECT 5854 / CIP 108499 / LMG 22089 / FP35) TaxID=1121939 RepID=S2L590_LITA3|nr:HIT family protein [Halomonas anticariensis]EPC02864.1 hypothetical protein L861_23930 [Halomonas anticariensis FP35 = DSM 16096]
MNDFSLDSRLESDSFPVTDLPLCQVRLMNDARFIWLVLIPRRPGIREAFELSTEDQAQLWREATALGQAMKAAVQGDKLNLATLGNVVAQLHLHVVVRKTDDAAWPAPVWGHGKARPYDMDSLAAMRDMILAQIQSLSLTAN